MKKIKVLGSGCAKCNKLYETAEKAARELAIEFELEKVTDMNTFVEYGVMMTPALVVNDTVKVTGSVPSVEKLKEMIKG